MEAHLGKCSSTELHYYLISFEEMCGKEVTCCFLVSAFGLQENLTIVGAEKTVWKYGTTTVTAAGMMNLRELTTAGFVKRKSCKPGQCPHECWEICSRYVEG